MSSPYHAKSITADTRGMTRDQVSIAMDYMGKQNNLAMATRRLDSMCALVRETECEWSRINREETEALRLLETKVLGRKISADEKQGITPVRCK